MPNKSRPESIQYTIVQKLADETIVWDSRTADTLTPPKNFIDAPGYVTLAIIEQPPGTIRRRLPLNVSAKLRRSLLENN